MLRQIPVLRSRTASQKVIERNAAPDAGVAVADGVPESEVPAHAHEHGGVQADITVASVVVFAGGAPRFLAGPTGEIHRIDQHGQRIPAADVRKFGDVDVIVPEHTRERAEQVSVHPEFRAIVHAFRMQPHLLAGIIGRNVELRAEPIGVIAAAHFVDVRNKTFGETVIVGEIRVRQEAVLHQVGEHGARNARAHPRIIVEARLREGFAACCLVLPAHFPFGGAAMSFRRVQVDPIGPAGIVGRNGGR